MDIYIYIFIHTISSIYEPLPTWRTCTRVAPGCPVYNWPMADLVASAAPWNGSGFPDLERGFEWRFSMGKSSINGHFNSGFNRV